MDNTILHYFYDPLCGWCYGAAPLVKVARSYLPVIIHGGGMMAGAHRQFVSQQLRNYVVQHDRRIAELTGQGFGEGYINGLLQDPQTLLDSEPPITAILAAEQLANSGLDMLARLQIAHYGEGQKISDRGVLLQLGSEISLDIEKFTVTFDAVTGDATQAHIRTTRRLMKNFGVVGFPGFVLESGDTRTLLNIAPYLGKPEAFAEQLQRALSKNSEEPQALAFSCGPDNCAI